MANANRQTIANNCLQQLPIGKISEDVFCKKGVVRNFAKFTGKHLCQA